MDKSCPVVVLGNNKEIMECQNVSILLCGVCVLSVYNILCFMLTGEKIIMILDCSFTNLAAAAAVNEMFWRGIKVFGRYENNAGYFLLFFRHERFDIEKMAVFRSLV